MSYFRDKEDLILFSDDTLKKELEYRNKFSRFTDWRPGFNTNHIREELERRKKANIILK